VYRSITISVCIPTYFLLGIMIAIGKPSAPVPYSRPYICPHMSTYATASSVYALPVTTVRGFWELTVAKLPFLSRARPPPPQAPGPPSWVVTLSIAYLAPKTRIS
jgi:hypothetical protein